MLDFYRDKKVFITGHTGFKGTWLSKMLINFGANVTGYSLNPIKSLNLFEISENANNMQSFIGDIRDFDSLEKTFKMIKPEIVIHLAAQPLVRNSYTDPRYTYETNVMGTVNVLECIRKSDCVKSFLNVTTDKVYKNNEWVWGYRETDALGGYDPYSNSKSCSELVTQSYKKSFFTNCQVAISTVRAGNVIGGGDFADDRIIPDCVRAIENETDIIIRNPHSIRPYQYVLEPLYAYLFIIQKQFEDKKFADNYNVASKESNSITTGKLVDIFCSKWEAATGQKLTWINKHDGSLQEANFLKLDCSKFESVFGWKSKCDIETAVEKTVEWVKVFFDKGNLVSIMDDQIDEFIKGINF